MRTRIIGIALSVIVFCGCQTRTASDWSEIDKADSSADNLLTDYHTGDSLETGDEFDYSDCIRGQATSVIKKSVYPNSTFKLNNDKHTGTN
jgi:hypothetical protein